MDIASGTRDDIQALRGVAVLMVVLFHLQAPYFENGFVGVDVFFVVSGYLMAKLYANRTPMEFYRKRIDRLFAGYTIAIAATLCVGYLVAVPVDFAQLAEQAIAAVFALSNVQYWSQNSYFDKTAFNPLLHLWSLGVEIQFYLLVPFLYPLLRRYPALFAAAFGMSLAACVVVQSVSPKTAFFMLPFRLWEFLIGAGVAWYARVPDRRAFGGEAARFGLAAVFLALPAVATIRPDAVGSVLQGHPSAFALAMTAATGAILAFGLPGALRAGPVSAALRWIGDRSYAIYLAHFPAIVLLNYEPFGGTRLRFESAGALVVGLVAIAATSLAMYRFSDRAGRPGFRSPAVKVGILAACLAGAVALQERSWAAYPPDLRNVLGAWTDRDVYRCGKVFRILNPTEILCPLDRGPDDKRVLLLGNSHADSIKRVFAEAARAGGMATYFAVPNDPLMPGGLTAARMGALVASHRIDAVVLHYSDVYADERTAREIAAFLRAAVASGLPTVLVGPVPTYGAHVPKAMFENPRSPVFPVETTFDAHRRRTAAYRDFARALEAEGVVALDPAPLLCPDGGACRYADDALRPFYFDDGHLTLTGAARLRPLFDAIAARVP
jgi:peptidoglycan/LPS O-acetylase OafA/YrhL